jgi:hypothetical protein
MSRAGSPFWWDSDNEKGIFMSRFRRKTVRLAAMLLATAGVLTGGLPVSAADATTGRASAQDSFDVQIQQLHQLLRYYGRAGDQVTFDRAAASPTGASASSLTLAGQFAAFSNDVVAAARTDGLAAAAPALRRYPELSRFFTEATQRQTRQASGPSSGVSPMLPPWDVCGYYNTPRPTRAAPWRTWGPFGNNLATLFSWGYYPSPIPGAGWTRPQTWNPLWCKTNTFRDNAVPIDGGYLNEQNYAGWSPRGEPNPDSTLTDPSGWPYPDWPAYVFWWHNTF